MAWFEGTHTEAVTVGSDLSRVQAHFADLEAIIRHSSDVESAETEGDVVHFVLEPQDHGIVKFQGKYSCRYQVADDGAVRWETVGEGNTDQSGEARFTTLPEGGTRVDYRETVKIDLDVPAMMAPVLKPLIGQVLARAIKGYLRRMVADLEA
jgi:uncharacterized membrane protein